MWWILITLTLNAQTTRGKDMGCDCIKPKTAGMGARVSNRTCSPWWTWIPDMGSKVLLRAPESYCGIRTRIILRSFYPAISMAKLLNKTSVYQSSSKKNSWWLQHPYYYFTNYHCGSLETIYFDLFVYNFFRCMEGKSIILLTTDSMMVKLEEK